MTNLTKALIAFQQECPEIQFDAQVKYKQVNFKYATLRNIVSIVRPILNKHKLAFSQIGSEGCITTRLMHESGEYLESSIRLPDNSNPQDLGKWITYLKRYQLASILGIVAEDDDDGSVKPSPQNGSNKTVNKGVAAAVEEELEKIKTADRLNEYWKELKEKHGKVPELWALCQKRGKELKNQT